MLKYRCLTSILISCLLLICLADVRGGTVLGLKGGMLFPKDSRSGFCGGIMFGKSTGDGYFTLGLSVDTYKKSYIEETSVEKFQDPTGRGELAIAEIEYSRLLLPIMLNASIKIPSGFSGLWWWTREKAGYIMRGKLGYEFLFSKETNFINDTNESHTFGGFGWGLEFCNYLSFEESVLLTMSCFYNNCKVSRNVGETKAGLPINEKVDVSGLGFQFGVELYF